MLSNTRIYTNVYCFNYKATWLNGIEKKTIF
jgi:hypothetical protein